MKQYLCLASIALLLFGSLIRAGTTGKISGRVTDDQGRGLAGVNLFLTGTSLGVASDQEGYYTILNIPPGTYSLVASMIGFARVTTENVTVTMDRTSYIDIRLVPEAVQLSEITVEAEKKVVVHDISASQLNIQSDQIVNLPVADITQIVGLQAGIEGMTIRGGSQRQTAYMVDGFLLNDERSNNPYTNISLNSISEVQVQTGGFNAEYGNIRSGVINVITREGDRRAYHGGATLRYTGPAPKHYGKSIYDRDSYFLRSYLDDEVCWTGTTSGAWDAYMQRQYPAFEGWNRIAEITTRDDDPDNDLTPSQAQRIFLWQHRRDGRITKPDYTLDFAFGGPLPGGGLLGNLRFNISHRSEQEVFVFPLSREAYNENITDLKIASDLSPQTKLTLLGRYGEEHSVSPYTWTTTPTGDLLRSTYSVANLTNASSGNAILFMPGFYSPATITRSMYGAKVNHLLSDKTFFEVIVQHFANRHNVYQMRLRDTTDVERSEVFPGFYADEAPFGYWGYGVTGIDGMIMGGWMNLGRDSTRNSTTVLRGDITSQVTPHHQFKSGFNLAFNQFRVRSSTKNPGMSTWTRSLVYDVDPYRLETYVQDKLEFEGFIANLGLRLEYSSANADHYQLSDYDEFFTQGYGDLIELQAPRDKSRSQLTLSPRLGVSHPITENSKLYFNYGHFQTEPASSYRFRIQRESNGLVTYIGNPNISLERTIAYELGYAHGFQGGYLLNLAAYYKDITDQPGWIFYQNVNNSVQYNKAANNNYEDIRGFEITLSKLAGDWISGFVNYTYMVETSGYFGYTSYYQDPNKMRDYLRINPTLSRPRPRPYLRVNFNFRTPAAFGPGAARFRPLGAWNLNVLGTWKTGAYETYNPNSIPGVVDDVQWVDRYNIDLRLTKKIRLRNFSLELFADVFNALDTRFLSYAGFADYYDYRDYLKSLRFPWEEGINKGHDRVGDYRDWDVAYDPLEPNPDNDPEIAQRNDERIKNKSYIEMPNIRAFTFLDPRRITLGIQVNF